MIGACNKNMLRFVKSLIAILAAALVIVVFANVLGRYFFNFALAWAEETARFLFIWLSFLGAILANAHAEHMHLTLFVDRVPNKIRKVMLIVANIVVLFILGLLVDGGATMVAQNYNWQTPALEISYGLVYSIAPVSCVIMMIQVAARLYKVVMVEKIAPEDHTGGVM